MQCKYADSRKNILLYVSKKIFKYYIHLSISTSGNADMKLVQCKLKHVLPYFFFFFLTLHHQEKVHAKMHNVLLAC